MSTMPVPPAHPFGDPWHLRVFAFSGHPPVCGHHQSCALLLLIIAWRREHSRRRYYRNQFVVCSCNIRRLTKNNLPRLLARAALTTR
jgi:hypothetical protein